MSDEEGVRPAESPAAETIAESPAAPAVTGVQSDRPVDNAVAEFNRKFDRVQRQINQVLEYVATQRQPPTTPAPQADVSEDDLWRLAQQGDKNAFDVYMERKAERVSRSQMQTVRQEQTVDQELLALGQMYPVFNDANHPLTATINQQYAARIAQGHPVGKATLLTAIKDTVTYRRDLIPEGSGSRAQTAVRNSAASRAQAGVTGATHRESQAPVTAPRLSPAEADLARRMGIKDPTKAKERFLKRNANGESSLGSVAAFINDKEPF